ncbi:MAG: hypothetical protein HYW02_03320 [Deltaproteobacteria bacterium]|nr:hypothetical protein [Deltaproteobacteria bacterium]
MTESLEQEIRLKPDEQKLLEILYHFRLKDGNEKRFKVLLDVNNLRLKNPVPTNPPPWTALTYEQCPNCPLKKEKEPFCPPALHLAEVIEYFKDFISYDEADITIETAARQYQKKTTLQRGLSSIIGLYMATSGCPVLNKLRPLAPFHLPFATLEETQYRILSMYLLAQYFLKKGGKKPDWGFKKLGQIYREIKIVNKAFSQRLRTLEGEDALPNAVVILNAMADTISRAVDLKLLQRMERLFKAYWE